MAVVRKRYSLFKKIVIAFVIVICIAGVTVQLLIDKYLPSLVKQRLENIIVTGSDSLYKFEVGKLDANFWAGTIHFSDLHISIDSVRYKKIEAEKKLPPLTFDFLLPQGDIKNINIRKLIFSKKIDIQQIELTEADVKLARHFRSGGEEEPESIPLWKLIQPGIRSIKIEEVRTANLKINYRNIDSASAFRWQLDKCNISFSDIMVDSISAMDTNRVLFTKNIAFAAEDVLMKTEDGLYQLKTNNISYSSATRQVEAKQFEFVPAVSDRQLVKYFGHQHEIYRLKMPVITVKNFQLPQWIIYNKLRADTIKLLSPVIAIHMDRNARPNPYSRKGKYPHQLLQKAPFNLEIKRLSAADATVVYTEISDKTQLTGKAIFPSLNGHIDNITNDSAAIARSNQCIVYVRGGVMKTGSINTVFRFNLSDKAGAFNVTATINDLNAAQLHSLGKAMTATELQSFNMHRLDYVINGNENSGTGRLSMKYDDMDILINEVNPDKSFDKKGLLSVLANRLVIYKENPMNDEEERRAKNVSVQRDVTRSFFNLIWKTLYSSAGKIVIRPAASRKIERRKERQQQQESKKAASEKK